MLFKTHLICKTMSRFRRPEVSALITAGQQKRLIMKDYDKPIKLDPMTVEYKYKDSKFFNEHRLEDQPYLQLTDEEIVDLSSVKLEKDYKDRHVLQIDINAAPYNQVLIGTDDGQRFTQTETIADKTLWFWVERLLPKKELPYIEPTDAPPLTPSGFRPPPKTKPDLDYFIARTRTHLFPVYRKYQIDGRNNAEYWKNRWDGLFNSHHKELLDHLHDVKWENNETTLTLTLIHQIKGNVWQFEEDIRGDLERQHSRKILSAVNEVNEVLVLKGDFVLDSVNWLINKGF